MGAALKCADRREEANRRFSLLSYRVYLLFFCIFWRVRIIAFRFIWLGTLKFVERGSNYFIYSTYFAPTLLPGAAALLPSSPRPATPLLVIHKSLNIHSATQADSIDTVTGL